MNYQEREAWPCAKCRLQFPKRTCTFLFGSKLGLHQSVLKNTPWQPQKVLAKPFFLCNDENKRLKWLYIHLYPQYFFSLYLVRRRRLRIYIYIYMLTKWWPKQNAILDQKQTVSWQIDYLPTLYVGLDMVTVFEVYLHASAFCSLMC